MKSTSDSGKEHLLIEVTEQWTQFHNQVVKDMWAWLEADEEGTLTKDDVAKKRQQLMKKNGRPGARGRANKEPILVRHDALHGIAANPGK